MKYDLFFKSGILNSKAVNTIMLHGKFKEILRNGNRYKFSSLLQMGYIYTKD